MNFPKLSDLNVSGKKVIVRMDLDVAEDYTRIETAKSTLSYLIEVKSKTIIIGHKGRPAFVETSAGMPALALASAGCHSKSAGARRAKGDE